MRQRKSKRVISFIFLLILVGSINNINLNNIQIGEVKSIKVSGLNEVDNKIFFKKIKNLNLTNIFFFNGNEINRELSSSSLIENYKVFKRYPSELEIQIEKTKFLAKINKDGKIYLIGSNGKFSNNNYSIQNLPYIFGNPKVNEFLNFKKVLDGSPVMYGEIKNLYFFQSKRWDLQLKNNILIKLPKSSVENALNDVSEFIKLNSSKNFKVIDARVKNQIIINE